MFGKTQCYRVEKRRKIWVLPIFLCIFLVLGAVFLLLGYRVAGEKIQMEKMQMKGTQMGRTQMEGTEEVAVGTTLPEGTNLSVVNGENLQWGGQYKEFSKVGMSPMESGDMGTEATGEKEFIPGPEPSLAPSMESQLSENAAPDTGLEKTKTMFSIQTL